MSIKMSVKYGDRSVPITEAPANDDIVTFFVKDGEQVIAGKTFDFGELTEGNRHRAFLYGCNKLVTDRTSDEKDKVDKLDAMQEVFDLLVSGEWAKERVVGAIVVSAEVEALAFMQNMSIPDTQTALAQYDKNVRKAILGREDVQRAAKAIHEGRKDVPAKTLDDMIPTS